jgi:ribokinase
MSPVIVVGSVNMDLVFTDLDHIPEPGETVRSRTFAIMPGGKGANQASASARLGTTTKLIARVGGDDLGAQALSDLAASGVDVSLIERVTGATGVAGVLIDRTSENVVIVAPGANAQLSPDTVEAAPDLEHAVVLACLEIPMETVVAWARLAQQRGWPFVLNPAPAQALPDELLPLISVLTPNQTELEQTGRSIEELLDAGVGAIVVTLGAEGAAIHRTGAPVALQSTFPVDPVDTTGAGDAFNGALAASLAAGHPLEAAVARGCAAGALATRAVGARASQPALDELERTLGEPW